MPKSRGRTRPSQKLIARSRWNWRHAAGGWAEFSRNLALVILSAPLLDPILTGAPLHTGNAIAGAGICVILLVASSILDDKRRDP